MYGLIEIGISLQGITEDQNLLISREEQEKLCQKQPHSEIDNNLVQNLG